MNIQVFQKYNRLVARGLVKPLPCTGCKEPSSLQADPEGEPLFVCYMCGLITSPGLAMYKNVEAVVNEHFYNHLDTNRFKGPV